MTLDQRIDYYSAKADDLLHRGDAAGGAEGRALLRECRRYRRKTRELERERDG
jgi:hypothetical protein